MTHAPRAVPLRDADLQRSLAVSVVEGMLWAVMVGLAETYFTAAAVHLGASALEVGLVAALPLLAGGIGALCVLRVLARRRTRRPLAALLALLQALSLELLAVLQALGTLTPGILIAALCAYQACSLGTGVAWSSWYGDLVPAATRGHYFARRQRATHVAMFLGLLAGGVVLHALEPEASAAGRRGVGFVLLFGLAGLFRMASAYLLWRSAEPAFAGLPPKQRALRFLATARGRNALRTVLGSSVFLVAVFSSAPFFAPLMLDELRFSWLAYMAVAGALAFGRVLALPLWGRAIDRHGARRAYAWTLLASALIPLPWIWIDSAPWAALAHVWTGLAWGGYEVALFALLLDSTVKRTRPLLFSWLYFANGLGQIGGSLGGAALLRSQGYAVLMAVSLLARLVVALALPRTLRRLPRERRMRP